MIFQDLTGQKFGNLTASFLFSRNNRGQAIWYCICDCGNGHKVLSSHLKNGGVKSCGCLSKGENRAKLSTIHGMSDSPEYTSYNSAKKRCNKKFRHKYPDYSGRGIEFRFKNFNEFYKEVGPRPEPKLEYSLERIDNEGHYEKGNVKWATKQEQARNRRCDNCEKLETSIKELEILLGEEV